MRFGNKIQKAQGGNLLDKLVQIVNWNLPNSPSYQMYMYGEADVESNKQMQKPLEKLYQYENKPDMREKVREYIDELGTEIKRCEKCVIDNGDNAPDTNNMLMARMQTLQEVINDLKGRLMEMVERYDLSEIRIMKQEVEELME